MDWKLQQHHQRAAGPVGVVDSPHRVAVALLGVGRRPARTEVAQGGEVEHRGDLGGEAAEEVLDHEGLAEEALPGRVVVHGGTVRGCRGRRIGPSGTSGVGPGRIGCRPPARPGGGGSPYRPESLRPGTGRSWGGPGGGQETLDPAVVHRRDHQPVGAVSGEGAEGPAERVVRRLR